MKTGSGHAHIMEINIHFRGSEKNTSGYKYLIGFLVDKKYYGLIGPRRQDMESSFQKKF
jgi:hypothetical protein